MGLLKIGWWGGVMTPLHGRSPAHWPPPPDLWYSSRVNKILVTPPPLLTGRSYGSLPAHTRLPSCALAIPCHPTEILEFPGWRVEGRCKILYPVLWKAFILQPTNGFVRKWAWQVWDRLRCMQQVLFCRGIVLL